MRDNFTDKTRMVLAARAVYLCCNPDCRRITAGPHTDPLKALTTGHAAHIHAASPKGPRYDPWQTKAQRKSAKNGLWMCRDCGTAVDADTSAHTAEQLRNWKHTHECFVTEIHKKGYVQTIKELEASSDHVVVKQIVDLIEDRRVFWAAFDAEFPDRVRRSLDHLRSRFGQQQPGSPMDRALAVLARTTSKFFEDVRLVDLIALRCDGGDPEWLSFRDALAAFRKSIFLQVYNLANSTGVYIGDDLKSKMFVSRENLTI